MEKADLNSGGIVHPVGKVDKKDCIVVGVGVGDCDGDGDLALTFLEKEEAAPSFRRSRRVLLQRDPAAAAAWWFSAARVLIFVAAAAALAAVTIVCGGVRPRDRNSAEPLISVRLPAGDRRPSIRPGHPAPLPAIPVDAQTSFHHHGASEEGAACPQQQPLVLTRDPELDAVYASLFAYPADEAYSATVAHKLSGLVQIPSVSYDDMTSVPPEEPLPDTDPRRKFFDDVRVYLAKTYPLVHKHLRLEVVNRYGLVFTWKGEAAELKPVMFTAHMGVVPVPTETLDRWTYPPFGGVVADGFVWGRGSVDCKTQLTALMEATETLLHHNHKPQRTIIIAFGFDEEISGTLGAKYIAEHIHSRYGTHNIAMILDEGSSLGEAHGATFAYLSVTEKGYMNVMVNVETAGGHSSVPPEHTGIGILADAVVTLERNPFPMSLGVVGDPDRESALLSQLRCEAAHGPTAPADFKRAIQDLDSSVGHPNRLNKAKSKLLHLLAKNPVHKSALSTTQAVDLISGGVKVNALPELSSATANYRVAADSSVGLTEKALLRVLSPVAARYNLSVAQVTHDGKTLAVLPSSGSTGTKAVATAGTLRLTTLSTFLDPAPRTPSQPSSKPFALVSAAIRHALARGSDRVPIVAPTLPNGNTDTRYFHGLSRHVFRFTPVRGYAGVHTVDERVPVADVVGAVGFFFELIRGVDEVDL